MSIIKDASLAPSGIKKIDWVRSYMPTLSAIEERFEKTKPFKGLKAAVSVHLEAKTANLALVLAKGGADVYLTGCNPLSTQDDVAAAVSQLGIKTFGFHGATDEEYENLLIESLKCHPNLIVDDGGDLVQLLCGKCADCADELFGGCEETTTGIIRLKARERQGTLPCAMMAVNDAKAKHYYDNKYGTGQSVWTAIMDTTNLIVAGKTVVVAGYGWCGKGIALRAKGMGANVIVTEIDPFKALDATMQNFRVMPMDEAAKSGDIFVTSTGCKDVITEKHFRMMKNDVILCNAGHFDCEVDVAALRRICVSSRERRNNIVGYTLDNGNTLNVLGDGRLVNLACGMGHPAEIMDMSFSVQALSLNWLVENRDNLTKKLYQVPDSIDDEIGWYKLGALGLSIDKLTDEQQAYLSGFEVK
ncbi:MAG: adenosylhomocysteinase [Clostridia bacterium]|nr:adenosylhomocysteinase [Clostridia bacterium]